MRRSIKLAGDTADTVRHEVLDALARDLNEICRMATLDLALQIGGRVLQALYNGDPEEWARKGTGRPSYRALAGRSDLVCSPSALCRAVSTYVLVERLGGRQRWRHLGASHFQEVLPLPAAEQKRLLSTADDEHWTVTRLRQAVRQSRRPRVVSLQRSALRALRGLSVQLGKLQQAFLEAHNGELEPASLGELREAIDVLEHDLQALRHELPRGPRSYVRELAALDADQREGAATRRSADRRGSRA
ncbi:MAG TPA: hypothetical protein VJN18_04595 [Polyangiaceae bacterium]|nr:hypothetical protein [Polyangiaceae bacterium]